MYHGQQGVLPHPPQHQPQHQLQNGSFNQQQQHNQYSHNNQQQSRQQFQQRPTGQHQRAQLRIPFEPATTQNTPIFFWDSATNQYVIPTSGRNTTPYGYLIVFGATNLRHLEALWKHREVLLEHLDTEGLETNLPKFGNSGYSSQLDRNSNNKKASSSTPSSTSASNSEKEKLSKLLEDLGFKSLQPVQPSATDTLKSNIVEALQSLGYQPETSKRPALPSNADPLDIKIRELEDQLESRNATKSEDPRAAKIAELTALLEKANPKTSDPRAVKIAELTALLEKANKKPPT
jgi:hypothetical protein